jgi:hypothetical protein
MDLMDLMGLMDGKSAIKDEPNILAGSYPLHALHLHGRDRGEMRPERLTAATQKGSRRSSMGARLPGNGPVILQLAR